MELAAKERKERKKAATNKHGDENRNQRILTTDGHG